MQIVFRPSRAGPGDKATLFAWPERIVDDLLLPHGVGDSEARARRLQRWVANGLLGMSEFSGWDSQKEALRLAAIRYEELNGPNSFQWQWVRGCDIDPVACELLTRTSIDDGGFRCVFNSIEDRLKPELKEVLNAMQPARATKIALDPK